MILNYDEMVRLAQEEWRSLHSGQQTVILVGTATCGRSAGSLEVLETFRNETKTRGLEVQIIEVGCIGVCYAEPVVCITKPSRPGILYGGLNSEKALDLIEEYLLLDNPLPEYALGTVGEGTVEGIPRLFETAFFKPQVRRVIRNCGFIDPANINHYLSNDGYSGLRNALAKQPEEIIGEIQRSGLRGRGGAGFPTWRKWKFCGDAASESKYLICNADEGDPGAFMNRSVLEGDPHSLLEGMIIAGYAIGASRGYIYCRAEYPLALERLRTAIGQASERALLGENILGSGFRFDITIKEGAGAFVCGEETALIASIEGERGMPRTRPPFPAISGLWGKPTIINNVETLVSVARIMQYGAEWYSQYGSAKSSGTKTFALVGKVKRTGLIEVPLGVTLRELIFEIGGGLLGDRKFKAVQTGGPSGGCLPAALLDTPVDYDSLNAAGSIMGSGGMVVMDEHNCMVDFARFFLNFARKESCGKCSPCRLGTNQMMVILEDITKGKGTPEDVELLVEMAEAVKKGSLCGLGQTAPNPVLTTIRYFPEEYMAHVKDKKCPARVCKALISYVIDPEKCTGCTLCARKCPSLAITGIKKEAHVIDTATCEKCGICKKVCTFDAVFTI